MLVFVDSWALGGSLPQRCVQKGTDLRTDVPSVLILIKVILLLDESVKLLVIVLPELTLIRVVRVHAKSSTKTEAVMETHTVWRNTFCGRADNVSIFLFDLPT